jgi:hypothetical protein
MAGRAAKGRKTSRPACGRAPRPVEFLAHAYATCDDMSEVDKGP